MKRLAIIAIVCFAVSYSMHYPVNAALTGIVILWLIAKVLDWLGAAYKIPADRYYDD